jgi:phospholipid/cholesterol/gamma-HCH transport system substrate-binding protein
MLFSSKTKDKPMISKEQKLRLGIFLLVSLVLLTAILAVLIVPKLKEKGDVYFINFKGASVNGVNEGADVKYQGVRIGKVLRLQVNPEDLNSILIYVRIQKGFPVKSDMRAALQYAGITGLRFVEISGGTIEAQTVEREGEIQTKKGLGEKAEDIVLNIDSVVEAVNQLLKPENRERIGRMLENLEQSSRVASNILREREQEIDGAIEKLDRTMAQVIVISENLNTFTAQLNELTGNGRIDRLITGAEEMVGAVSQRFSSSELGQTLEKLDNFLDTASVSIRKIETRFHDLEGQLSKTLVNLRESMENIARFTRELTEDPTVLLRTRPGKGRRK